MGERSYGRAAFPANALPLGLGTGLGAVTAYLMSPPTTQAQAWNNWTPEIVAEVVSKRSQKRDYETKPGDYLAAGVRWIGSSIR
jgi:hypothetical protein